MSGDQLSMNILSTIKDLDLDMQRCPAQTDDDAGTMSGTCIGAAQLIKKK